MQFIVTHLTRMREGICTAGPEPVSGALIRMTPAMAAEVSQDFWKVEDLVAPVD